MLGKRSWPAAGKPAGPLRSGLVDSRSPLECKMPSPRGLKNYDQGGVGLGIVVALNKPSHISASGGGEILPKYAICGQFSAARSSPIPVASPAKAREMEMREGFDEEFTYVTCNGPNKSITTKVYYDRGDEYGTTTGRNSTEFCGGIRQNIGVFRVSPARLFDERSCPSVPDSDFLSSCHLCKKGLHGKDIYMYRGEKAFCSTECRQRQIRIDERKEQCRSKIARSNDVVSSSPYNCTSRGPMFSTGLIAV